MLLGINKLLAKMAKVKTDSLNIHIFVKVKMSTP